jgi:hypothetical protein
MQYIKNKKMFFLSLFLFCAQFIQSMDNQLSAWRLKWIFEQKKDSNMRRLKTILSAQKIEILPHVVSVQEGGKIGEAKSFGFTWNADASACGKIVFACQSRIEDDSRSIEEAIFLQRYYIKNGKLEDQMQKWDNIYYLQEWNKPFFNEKNDFSYYIFTEVNNQKNIFECAVSPDGKRVEYPCLLHYKKGTSAVVIPLSSLQDEPNLLCDVLHSPSKLVIEESGLCNRVFEIEDVVFSKRYEQLAQDHNFWLCDWIFVRPRVLYEEVIEIEEEIFDAETYFAQRPDRVEVERDKHYDIRKAFKMAMWYQCLCKKISGLCS